MPYSAAATDIGFILDHVVGFDRVTGSEPFSEATPDVVQAVLSEAARLSDEVLAPLQRAGDLEPARLEDGRVVTSPGFSDGWRAIAEGGWIGLAADPEFGGQGLPQTLAIAVQEMFSGACLALSLAPLLSLGQVEALEAHGSDAQKAALLPNLTSGAWLGTMNLTEPQAGSDVGALRTKAEPQGDGSYRITGEKIFITWADADFIDNVSHLVLARLPDAPPDTKGISLFQVPRNLPDGTANALRVVSLEHKLGIHGSPTAVMAYEGAAGWMVGEPGGGMAAMFTMMNNARLGVAAQGVGVAEAANQAALDYARDRSQGGTKIVNHSDVRRMLGEMRAETFAARAIALDCAVAIDLARLGERGASARAAFLTPIAKVYGTEVGERSSSTAIQVHGGMGFIEETGVAQFLRDVRITSIYEGTNGIQALDLVVRKMRDGGEAAFALIDEICDHAEAARKYLPELADPVYEAAESLRDATEALLARLPEERGAGAVPYLSAWAHVLGADKHLAAAKSGDEARLSLAGFYIRMILPRHAAALAAANEADHKVGALSF